MTPIEQLVQGYYLRVDNDPHSVHELFSQDAAYHRPGYESLIGRERLKYFYNRERVIASGRHEVEQIIATRHSAAARGHFEGQSHTGETLRISFADFFSFQLGLINARTTYFFLPGI